MSREVEPNSSNAGGAEDWKIMALAVPVAAILLIPLLSYGCSKAAEQRDLIQRYRAAVCATVGAAWEGNGRGRELCVAPDGRVFLYDQVKAAALKALGREP